jgi:hypothetical protein
LFAAIILQRSPTEDSTALGRLQRKSVVDAAQLGADGYCSKLTADYGLVSHCVVFVMSHPSQLQPPSPVAAGSRPAIQADASDAALVSAAVVSRTQSLEPTGSALASAFPSLGAGVHPLVGEHSASSRDATCSFPPPVASSTAGGPSLAASSSPASFAPGPQTQFFLQLSNSAEFNPSTPFASYVSVAPASVAGSQGAGSIFGGSFPIAPGLPSLNSVASGTPLLAASLAAPLFGASGSVFGASQKPNAAVAPFQSTASPFASLVSVAPA